MNGVLTLTFGDWVVVLLTLGATIIAGLRADAKVDYILAGRRLTTPLFAASLIATWYGSVLGAGEFIARHGIVMILCFGVPYYLVAILYALFLSKAIRSSTAVSISDQLRATYGDNAGYVAAVLMLVISIPAPYILSLGYVVSSITDLPLWFGVISGTILALFVVAKGGLQSDIRANVIQVIVMYVGFLALAVWSIYTFGAPSQLWPTLPNRLTELPGSIGWSGIAVWFLIAFQTFIDPNFHVRSAAAMSGNVARRGLLWSVAGWIIFDSIQLIVGLYAVAYAPNADPAYILLHSAEHVLPSMWKGLFLSGVIAAIMSTLDGYALSSATIIGHDLIDRSKGGGHRRSSLYIGLLVTGAVGALLAIALPSVVDLIFYAASIAVPALLLPLLVSLRLHRRHQRTHPSSVLVLSWMITPAVIALLSTVLREMRVIDLEPMLLGLIGSVVFLPRILSRHEPHTHI